MVARETLQFVEIRECHLPLKTPMSIRPGLELKERLTVFLRFHDERGQDYWGECPILVGVHQETQAEAMASLRQWLNGSQGQIQLDWQKPISWSSPYFGLISGPSLPSLCFALEQILWQAIFHHCPNSPRHGSLPRFWQADLCALLSLAANDWQRSLQLFQGQGFKIVKAKIGRASFAQDLERLELALASSNLRFRLDANQNLSLVELDALNSIDRRARIEVIEEPFAADHPAWNQYQGICPLARDESLWEMAASQFVVPSYPFKCVLKPARMGISGCLGWAQTLPSGNSDLILSSCYESGWSQIFHLQLAAFLQIKSALGLGTYQYLAEDVLVHRLPLEQGQLSLDLDLPKIDLSKLTEPGTV